MVYGRVGPGSGLALPAFVNRACQKVTSTRLRSRPSPLFQLPMLTDHSSATSLTNLRHVYTLYYTIHISRMDRLILRLGTPSNNTVPSRPESIRQTPPPSSAAGISYGSHYESPPQTQTQNNCSHGGAGVPLTEEKEMQYAQILADELLQVAEYKETLVRVLVEELAGGMGVA